MKAMEDLGKQLVESDELISIRLDGNINPKEVLKDRDNFK